MKTALVVCLQVLLVAWSAAAVSPIDILRSHLRRKGGYTPMPASMDHLSRLLSRAMDNNPNIRRVLSRMTGDGDEHCWNGRCIARDVRGSLLRPQSHGTCMYPEARYSDILLFQEELPGEDVVDIVNFKFAEPISTSPGTVGFYGVFDVLKELNDADTELYYFFKNFFSPGSENCLGFDSCGMMNACDVVRNLMCLDEYSKQTSCQCPVPVGSYDADYFMGHLQTDPLPELQSGVVWGGFIFEKNDAITLVMVLMKKGSSCN